MGMLEFTRFCLARGGMLLPHGQAQTPDWACDLMDTMYV